MASVCRIVAAARCSLLARRSISSTCPRKDHIQGEPPYLDAGGPAIPDYSEVNVQIKGYDFTVLEHYGKWIHKTAVNMGIDVADCWATPCEKLHIQTFKPRSVKVEADYHLDVYERNIQLADLPSIKAPLFLEMIQAALPEGVELSIHEHEPEHTEVRYIPDLELRGLYSQLSDLGGPSKK